MYSYVLLFCRQLYYGDCSAVTGTQDPGHLQPLSKSVNENLPMPLVV